MYKKFVLTKLPKLAINKNRLAVEAREINMRKSCPC